jgi:hypothetical protein
METPVDELLGIEFGLVSAGLVDGKEGTFWHLVTRDGAQPVRVYDPRRCERIRWIRCLVDFARANSSSVVVWSKRHRQEDRTMIALSDFSYVVVLIERRTRALLLTAFAVDRRHEEEVAEAMASVPEGLIPPRGAAPVLLPRMVDELIICSATSHNLSSLATPAD